MADLFDILKDISFEKRGGLVTDENEKDYSPFVVNMFLASNVDCVLHVAEMNRFHHIPKKVQYDFLRLSISRRRRTFKWAKKKEADTLTVVADYYGISLKKAGEIVRLHTDDQISYMRGRLDRGGVK